MELGVRLEGVMQRHEEGRLAHVFQDGPLRPRVLGRLGFGDDGRFPEHFHGVKLVGVVAGEFTDQKHLPVGWRTKKGAGFKASPPFTTVPFRD